MTFNPKDHLIKIQGRDYLETKWREFWFRDDHPTGSIVSEVIAMPDFHYVRATVSADGVILATGMATIRSGERQVWTGRDLEKAETAAIGRALAHAGYGTQFTDEDESDNLADSPVEKPASKQTERPADAWNMTTLTEQTKFLYNGNDHEQRNSLKKHTSGEEPPLIPADASTQRAVSLLIGYKTRQAFEARECADVDNDKALATFIRKALDMSLSEWMAANKPAEEAWNLIQLAIKMRFGEEVDLPF
jgi:hypothetical protein